MNNFIFFREIKKCNISIQSTVFSVQIGVIMKILNCIALTLTIIGAINWGLIGFFNFDLVAFIFGNMSVVSRIIYAVVGLCGLYLITFYGLLCDRETA